MLGGINMTKDNPSPSWGGSRPGSGRKPTGRKRVQFWVNAQEEKQIRALLAQLRKDEEK